MKISSLLLLESILILFYILNSELSLAGWPCKATVAANTFISTASRSMQLIYSRIHLEPRSYRLSTWKCIRIRGGHGRPWDGISCEEAEEAMAIPIRNHPRPGLDHAPWIEAHRQAYNELREYNRSQLLSRQAAGEQAPKVPISWQAQMADMRNPGQETTETWEDYWKQVLGPAKIRDLGALKLRCEAAGSSFALSLQSSGKVTSALLAATAVGAGMGRAIRLRHRDVQPAVSPPPPHRRAASGAAPSPRVRGRPIEHVSYHCCPRVPHNLSFSAPPPPRFRPSYRPPPHSVAVHLPGNPPSP